MISMVNRHVLSYQEAFSVFQQKHSFEMITKKKNDLIMKQKRVTINRLSLLLL